MQTIKDYLEQKGFLELGTVKNIPTHSGSHMSIEDLIRDYSNRLLNNTTGIESDANTLDNLLKKTECRIENEPETGDVYLTIVNRQHYPRLWIDNDIDGAGIIAETPESMLLRNNPFLEKDWHFRFVGDNIQDCINQYINLKKANS